MTPAGALQGCKILVVEDEYHQAREIEILLERAGAEVVESTGHAADVPALLQDRAIDAVLLDINLGRGADFSLARQLREARVPFLFMTGYDESAIPADLAGIARIEKPACEKKVVEQLVALTSRKR